MGYIIFFICGVIFTYLTKSLTNVEENDENISPNKVRYSNVKYYSNGLEIPLSFSKEYKIIMNKPFNEEFTNNQIEDDYYSLIVSESEMVRTMFNQNTKVKTEFVYDSEMFYLAKEYLINENEYLTNLN